jgi:MFS family permease
VVPLLFWLRKSLAETGVFLSRKRRLGTAQAFAILASNWQLVVLGMLLSTMTTVNFYLITAYTPTFGQAVLHLTSRQSLFVTLCVGLSNFLWLPVGGAISDRVGRRFLLVAFTVATLITAYPAMFWLVSTPTTARLLVVELWFSCIFGCYNGAMVPFLTEIMPQEVRTTGFSLAFSLATAVFGGFTPAICTYLIHVTGNQAMPAVWLSAAALCGLAATAILGWRGLMLDSWESSPSIS